ncbi:unnamed protein product [Brassica oleracea var. botrytis]|uniref:(rape) hypothetical protein n=1 Tax=Brassica napus TaxID=3708 RepID=A0A816JQU7_BRANA|nr:hypothetical protein HID58_063093 [Brassica napus]CAF1868240.1 unnamed protein product [Brassica napus]
MLLTMSFCVSDTTNDLELKDAADNEINTEMLAFLELHRNQHGRNVMIMSGDQFAIETLGVFKAAGFKTLAAWYFHARSGKSSC